MYPAGISSVPISHKKLVFCSMTDSLDIKYLYHELSQRYFESIFFWLEMRDVRLSI
jgi:hypothetical protein